MNADAIPTTAERSVAFFETMMAERAAAEDARRAELTPHVRAVQPSTRTRWSSTGPHARTAPAPITLCGAEPTIEDWDARTAASKAHAAAAEQRGVCPTCLALARERAAQQKDLSTRRREQRASGGEPTASAKQVAYALELLARTGHDPRTSPGGRSDSYAIAVLGLRPQERDRPVADVLAAMSPRRISAAISDLRAELT